MTKAGISTTVAPGSEQSEKFKTQIGRKRVFKWQYDYRHTDGELFSCVGNSLKDCQAKRDEWLEKKTWAEKSQKNTFFDTLIKAMKQKASQMEHDEFTIFYAQKLILPYGHQIVDELTLRLGLKPGADILEIYNQLKTTK